MDPKTPMTLAGATYETRQEAIEAYKTIWEARHKGEFDHMDVAVLTKDEDGQLEVERHNSTTEHQTWGSLMLGGALTAICPPAGVAALGVAATGATTGIAAWIGHFYHQIPKEDIQELGTLLDSGESAVFVVTVNPKQTDIAPLLMHPEKYKVIQATAGDWDDVARQAMKQGEKNKAAAGKAATGA